MRRRLQVVVVGGFALLAALACAASAPAAVPVKGALGYGADSFTGVVGPDGDDRYTAISTREGTMVQRISTENGAVERTRFLRGEALIPAVAFDGSPGGLSADGSTLVLTEPAFRFPQRDSVFPVLETNRLRVADTVTLDGTWTYDALSVDGRWLYLIEYTSRTDPTQYEVRRYDLDRGRLDPQPIVDPEESSEDMYGLPMTRATSPDGRWAYTLYDGAEHPFIHALDTERGAAVCIDLDPGAVSPRRLIRMSLDPSSDGATLTVRDPKEGPVAIVDTNSFEVGDPPAPEAASADSGGSPWLAIALGALVAAVLAIAAIARRRSRRVRPDDLERLVRIEGEEASQERERVQDPAR